MVHVKVCGVTNVGDAVACALAGANAIGVNLVPGSPRRVSEDTARAIVRAIGEQALVVAVVADRSAADMLALKDRLGVGCLQLHGDEPPEALEQLLPHAYKAIRVANAEDVAAADRYAGEYLLVDAKVPGKLGGTGTAFDWSLVRELAQRRKILLAGGLTPDNVAAAVRAVRPDSVDVASGVEKRGHPGRKDLRLVRALIVNAANALSSG